MNTQSEETSVENSKVEQREDISESDCGRNSIADSESKY